MRVLIVNTVCGVTSTGRIVSELARDFLAKGDEVRVAYGREPVPEADRAFAFRIGGEWNTRLAGLSTRLTDRHALGSRRATARFLRQAEAFDPELLWLHNLHGYYLNIEMLFQWIKSRPGMRVRWTLHDCWAFTGHCPYFSVAGCERWQTGCHDCPQKKRYPASLLRDGSRENWRRKKAAFTGATDLTLQVPSEWLRDLVKESFLAEYPVEVVPNTVNTEIFRPTESDFRARHGLENKKIVLGVGTLWDRWKGLPDFITLSRTLPEDFQVVLVGMKPAQIAEMPESLLCIPRTDSARELAGIYTAADVTVSASREETFGMTIAESAACGTPAVVYQGTACEEVALRLGGKVVPQDVDSLRKAVIAAAREGKA